MSAVRPHQCVPAWCLWARRAAVLGLAAVMTAVCSGAGAFEPAGEVVSLPDSVVARVFVDPGGYVWALTGADPETRAGRIAVVDPGHRVSTPFSVASGLAGDEVRAVGFEHVGPESVGDNGAGAVWIGTDSGISVLSRTGVFTTLTAGNCPLPGNRVRALFIGADNTKWIALDGRGVCCVDEQFQWAAYRTADGLCSDAVQAICEDSLGNVWFGTQGGGVSYLDRDGRWGHFSAANSGLISDFVTAVAVENPRTVWFVTPAGVSQFDGRNWTSYTGRNSPIGGGEPTAIVIDRFGTKWIGTRRGGLFSLDRFGRWSCFSTDTAALPSDQVLDLALGGDGALWVATAAGLCRFGGSAPGVPEASGQDDGAFAGALMWENLSEDEQPLTFSVALPGSGCGGLPGYYAAIWDDPGIGSGDLRYTITGDQRGNMRLDLQGVFSRAVFLISGEAAVPDPAGTRAAGLPCPFPTVLPEELVPLVQPGEGLPSADPALVRLARSLVRPDSENDMLRTVCDIVYSARLQRLGLQPGVAAVPVGGTQPGRQAARLVGPQEVSRVLQDNAGDSRSRARLVCTLLRAAGVPAQILMNVQGEAWARAWVAGLGWVPIGVSFPVYDYLRPRRTGLLRSGAPADRACAGVTGADDDLALIRWTPPVAAYCVKGDAAGLQEGRSLGQARLLLTRITSGDARPTIACIPIGSGLRAAACQQQGRISLVFFGPDGARLHTAPLELNGLSVFVNVEGRLLWKFIPRKIGDLLVIENLEYLQRPSPPVRTGGIGR